MKYSPEQPSQQPELPQAESAVEVIETLLEGTHDPMKVTRQLIAYLGKVESNDDRVRFILRCREAMDVIKRTQELAKDDPSYSGAATHLGVLFRIVHEQYVSQIAVFQTPSPQRQEYVPED